MIGARVALLLFIEPTSYIAAEIRALEAAWPNPVETYFLTENASQDWQISLAELRAKRLPVGRWDAARLLLNLISAKRCQIVHLAGWGHPLLMLAIIIAWWRGVPCTVESDTFDDSRTSHSKRFLKALIYPVLFRLPTYFLPGGTSQSRYLSRYGVTDARRRIAQMTVDVAGMQVYFDRFGQSARHSLRQALRITPTDVAFLFVGRLEPYKGISDLLGAFQGLRSFPATVQARLLVVGTGAMSSEVAIAAAGTCPSVHALGRLTGEVLMNAYAAADVLVLPSHHESWGLVVNEAMAAGLPVVVSDHVGCVADLVDGRGVGLVFQAGSVPALEAAMQVMLVSPEVRQHMAVAARSVISGWTMTEMARIITLTWREVVCS